MPYLKNRNILADIENARVVAKGAGHGGEKDWELGRSRHTLLNTEVTYSRILLCSAGNWIQCPPINHNGQEDEQECAFSCIVGINTAF